MISWTNPKWKHINLRYPEYPTQDILLAEDVCSSSDETTESEVLELEQLRVGDIVEVYWEGEHEWYEGECTNVDLREHQFEIVYVSDGVRLWHNAQDYPVRYSG